MWGAVKSLNEPSGLLGDRDTLAQRRDVSQLPQTYGCSTFPDSGNLDPMSAVMDLLEQNPSSQTGERCFSVRERFKEVA